jgi:ABC-type branched-subunit amino acid transport system ATPase component
MNAITVKHLAKSFGGLRAVDDLSADIPAGITTGLIGPNGSGKTTLMNLMSGLLGPDCGAIEIAGKSFDKIRPEQLRSLRVARTFQDGRLIGQLSVADNLLLAIAETGVAKGLTQHIVAPTGLAPRPDSELGRLEQTLAKIGLTEKRDALAEELSYGQRKLLELGRAIIQDVDIYLLDEPFTGLFAKMVDQVSELINDLKRQKKTIVIIEHNMGLIKQLADHTIVLDHGQLLAAGAPDTVLKDKSVQQAYLGV